MNILNIGKSIKLVNRYTEILRILIKYGFDEIIDILITDLSQRIQLNILKKHDKSLKNVSTEKRFRLVLEELGPTFIKLGQVLSVRIDLLPDSYIQELKSLQDKIKPLPFSVIEKLLKQDFNTENLTEVFELIDSEPIACASIAQVHTAVLKNKKNKVVLKIKKPDIEKTVKQDLIILRDFAQLLEKHIDIMQYIKPTNIVEQLSVFINQELRFKNEKQYLKLFYDSFQDEQNIIIPEIYDDYCTPNIIVMEYLDTGLKIDDIENINKINIDKEKITNLGTKLILKQIFEMGIFHADPHPGNILVFPENKIGLLDFGIMGVIDEEILVALAKLLQGILSKDVSLITNIFYNLNVFNSAEIPNGFKKDVKQILELYYNIPLKDIQFKEIQMEIIYILKKYKIVIPEEFIILIRTLMMLDGVGRLLNPEYNILFNVKKYFKPYLAKRLILKKQFHDVRNMVSDLNKFIKSLPKDLHYIINKLKDGTATIQFEHHNLDGLINSINKFGKRLSFALIIASLIIGTSFIIQSRVESIFKGATLIVTIVFILSVLISIGYIIYSTLKK